MFDVWFSLRRSLSTKKGRNESFYDPFNLFVHETEILTKSKTNSSEKSTMSAQPIASARYLGNESNIGVKGLRIRHRSNSDALQTFENPQEISAESKTEVKSIWGSEDDATIARKHANWKRLRELQNLAISRKLNMQDVLKAIIAIYGFHKLARFFGFSARKVGSFLLLANFLRAIYNARAPKPTFPEDSFLYKVYPIVGNIGLVIDSLKRGLPNVQLESAKLRNFTSSEVVLFGGTRDIAIMDPRDREHYLKTNWRNYVKNGVDGEGFQENFAEIMGRGIFAVDGEEWQDHRKVASHLFSANGLKSKMEHSFTHHGAKLVELLKRKAETGETLDFQCVMADLTFETICDIAFGVDPGSMEAGLIRGEKIDFLIRFDRAQQFSAIRFVIPVPIWKFLRFLNVGTEKVLREDCEQLNRYVSKIVEERKNGDSAEKSDDLLSMYIRTAKTSGKAYMQENDYLIDAILNFMIAGRDTTSCTLTNLFKLLSTNPEAEEKLLKELDQVVGRGNAVTWDHIRDLKYGGAVFNETLRLYPPVGGDTRIALQPDIMPSGIRIEAGQRVSITNIAIGRDSNLWDRPDEFLPERWLQPDKPTRRPDEYMFPVFWGGPRLCLGKDMARLETLAIAYAVLSNYHVKVLPHSEKMVNGPVQFYEEGLPAQIVKISN